MFYVPVGGELPLVTDPRAVRSIVSPAGVFSGVPRQGTLRGTAPGDRHQDSLPVAIDPFEEFDPLVESQTVAWMLFRDAGPQDIPFALRGIRMLVHG